MNKQPLVKSLIARAQFNRPPDAFQRLSLRRQTYLKLLRCAQNQGRSERAERFCRLLIAEDDRIQECWDAYNDSHNLEPGHHRLALGIYSTKGGAWA